MAETLTVREAGLVYTIDVDKARLADRQPLVIERQGTPIAVLVSFDEYRRLKELDVREGRRRRALAIPIEAARSAETWQASFESLERIRDKATYLSDDEMGALVTEALARVRDSTPKAVP